ncbi:Heat shock protein Hsp90 [Corchorus capsularis]|uniref:Heat shock protein Hsp90 n=1 Tax=Corchorus capsularis TaxID=210143 RepID=A0A1R3HQ19_COCAP|nr:Heat shock protein Hsp90 [Corchorus capsularis]
MADGGFAAQVQYELAAMLQKYEQLESKPEPKYQQKIDSSVDNLHSSINRLLSSIDHLALEVRRLTEIYLTQRENGSGSTIAINSDDGGKSGSQSETVSLLGAKSGSQSQTVSLLEEANSPLSVTDFSNGDHQPYCHSLNNHAKVGCPQLVATEFFGCHEKINQSFDVSIPAKKSCLGSNKNKDQLAGLEELPVVTVELPLKLDSDNFSTTLMLFNYYLGSTATVMRFVTSILTGVILLNDCSLWYNAWKMHVLGTKLEYFIGTSIIGRYTPVELFQIGKKIQGYILRTWGCIGRVLVKDEQFFLLWPQQDGTLALKDVYKGMSPSGPELRKISGDSHVLREICYEVNVEEPWRSLCCLKIMMEQKERVIVYGLLQALGTAQLQWIFPRHNSLSESSRVVPQGVDAIQMFATKCSYTTLPHKISLLAGIALLEQLMQLAAYFQWLSCLYQLLHCFYLLSWSTTKTLAPSLRSRMLPWRKYLKITDIRASKVQRVGVFDSIIDFPCCLFIRKYGSSTSTEWTMKTQAMSDNSKSACISRKGTMGISLGNCMMVEIKRICDNENIIRNWFFEAQQRMKHIGYAPSKVLDSHGTFVSEPTTVLARRMAKFPSFNPCGQGSFEERGNCYTPNNYQAQYLSCLY